MRQDHRGDGVHRAIELGERGRKLLVVAGETAVDDGESPVGFKEVPTDPVRAEPIDALSNAFEQGHLALSLGVQLVLQDLPARRAAPARPSPPTSPAQYLAQECCFPCKALLLLVQSGYFESVG